jgi:zinc protease
VLKSTSGEFVRQRIGTVNLPQDYVLIFRLRDSNWSDFVSEVNALTPAQVQSTATRLVKPDALTWLVVGDLSRIESGIRKLNLGEVSVLDADGQVAR